MLVVFITNLIASLIAVPLPLIAVLNPAGLILSQVLTGRARPSQARSNTNARCANPNSRPTDTYARCNAYARRADATSNANSGGADANAWSDANSRGANTTSNANSGCSDPNTCRRGSRSASGRHLRCASTLLQKISGCPATACGARSTSDGSAASRNIEEVIHLTGRRTGTACDVASPRTRCARCASASCAARPRGAGRCAARSCSDCARARPRSSRTRSGRGLRGRGGPRRWSGTSSRGWREPAAARGRASASTTATAATSPATASASAAAGVDLELHDEDTNTDDQHDKGNTFHDRTWTRMVW